MSRQGHRKLPPCHRPHFHVVFPTKNRESRLADVVRDIKAVSSKRIHDETGVRAFARQEEHHRYRTFQEEYLELLHRCGVDFDERYLW
ncbi:MAG: hypothetical protein MUF86_05445 [Akkermansiaceae bacterium]|nr:hypothetical protein [Akkermansiaceae bacterium]